MTVARPTLRQTVLDCREPRPLADFYRELLGYAYRAGDETPEDGEDWLVIGPPGVESRGGHQLAFQGNPEYVPPVWTPRADRPGDQQMMLHLDLTVPDVASLEEQRTRALALGAAVLLDRTDDPDEPLYVLADPAGHPFCIFVA